MQLHIKTYKFLKVKKYFKKSSFILIFNTITPKNIIVVTQNLKNLNLNYYKLHNTLTKKILKNSVYTNYQFLIQGLTFLIKPKKSYNIINLDKNFTFMGLKLNNKIYFLFNINSSIQFNYFKSFLFKIITLKTFFRFIKRFETM